MSARLSDLLPAYPGDWPEDFKDENGQYMCVCVECDSHFWGYKRRIICKQCATKENAGDG